MKRMTCFVMALALVLGLAQCKKEQPETPQNEGNSVMITLNVNGDASTGSANNGTRVDVNTTTGEISFKDGDKIEVASNDLHVGTLNYNNDGTFSGYIENATYDKPLYFYFFGNDTPQYFDEGSGMKGCTVYIGEQTGDLPVISMGPSINPETGAIVNFEENGVRSFSARLHNKCSLMKFNVDTPSTDFIFIEGMNNFVTVNFSEAADDEKDNGFSYSQVYDGKIKMKQNGSGTNGTKTYWAIVLPQPSVAARDAYTEDGRYIGTRPAIEGGIGSNQYFSAGVDITMAPFNPINIPLTFEAKAAGTTVTLNRVGNAPSVSLQTSRDGITWSTYSIGSPITLDSVGDKVMFCGTNAQYATSPSDYHNFSIIDSCYVYGNIMSLINATDYATTTSLGNSEDNQYTFACLFQDCEGLYTHTVKTLKLPATELTDYCYSQMFYGCTHLTVATELPTGDDDNGDLKEGCYQSMFQGCTGLKESPVLPAATLVQSCYASMFSGCTRLSRVTCLATSGINCLGSTSSWMSSAGENVTGTKTFAKATGANVSTSSTGSDDTWPKSFNGIPSGWTSEDY